LPRFAITLKLLGLHGQPSTKKWRTLFQGNPRLTDLRHDRYDCHARGKGEGKDHSHEYLFHSIRGYRSDILPNIRMLFLRKNT